VHHALQLLPPDFPLQVLPALPIGKSNEHVSLPGTLSLSAATLIALWKDVGESVARAGVKKLVIFNSHGGQTQIGDIVARDLRIAKNMLVVTSSWFSMGLPPGLYSESEVKHGIHGGDIETSMMLHLQPALVDMVKAKNFQSLSQRLEKKGFKHLRPEGGCANFGWQMQDLNSEGACGDASAASAEKGRVTVGYAAQKLVELLEEVDRFSVATLKDAGKATL